ncbi:cation transporter [Cellulomonas humilata]|uniref:Cation transporter n=1 Tax=Cellulomonas humilata TaxID=144055 RepID=A0A7Y6A3W0_9CELL|nr:cation transporter [Cellulomonas humilata]
MTERRAIHESIAGAAVLGTLAVVWGIAAQSRVLLFDGAFILLGIVLSALSLMASRAAAESPTTRFPFGKAAVTPLAIAVQGVALLGTLLYAAVDAVAIITAGGSDVAAGTVVAYGLITMTCSYALARWLTHRAPSSELVAAEVAQWRAGALLSLVFAVGAGLALALSSVGDVVRYVDPVLVLVACLVLAPIPLRLLRAAGLELLEAAPPPLVQNTLDAAVASVRAEFGLDEPFVRSTKLGSRLYVEVDFVVPSGEWDVAGEDRVRRALIAHLEPLGYELWANVELTTDPELAR